MFVLNFVTTGILRTTYPFYARTPQPNLAGSQHAAAATSFSRCLHSDASGGLAPSGRNQGHTSTAIVAQRGVKAAVVGGVIGWSTAELECEHLCKKRGVFMAIGRRPWKTRFSGLS